MFKSSKNKKNSGLVEFVKTVVYALILAGIIRTLLFQPFWIPSGSMKPTLLVGDFIFVNKFSYGYSRYSCPFSLCPIDGRLFAGDPDRGDVVVFRNPINGKDFVKRVIGLPGDKLYLKDGKLWLNNVQLVYEELPPFEELKKLQGPMASIPRCSNAPVTIGGNCKKAQAREYLSSEKSYPILDIREGAGDNTLEVTVPEGNYFFLGDNRDNSLDSRYPIALGGVGFVPSEYLVGKAQIVVFSSAGSSILAFWTWRLDRFLKVVK